MRNVLSKITLLLFVLVQSSCYLTPFVKYGLNNEGFKKFSKKEKLAGNNQDDQKRINKIFWNNITDENNYDKINYLKDKLRLSVSSSFLKNNQNLF